MSESISLNANAIFCMQCREKTLHGFMLYFCGNKAFKLCRECFEFYFSGNSAIVSAKFEEAPLQMDLICLN